MSVDITGADRQLMKATVLAESSGNISLSAPVMSTDTSQVGVAHFLPFNILFTFPGFPFILLQVVM